MGKKWRAVRVHVMLALMGAAATAHAWKAGREAGIREQIGGPGRYKTALVEWQDYSERKVVLYLNDGANGYAFWMKLNPAYRHYTAASKVFVCDNESPEDMREKLEWAREWCRDDKEGHDTRIIGGELKPRADDGDLVVVGNGDLDEMEHLLIRYDRQCLKEAREAVSELALERDRLRARISALEAKYVER
jgi:hypothetical protein